MNVERLRKEKYKVRVCHKRWYATDQIKPEYFLFSRYELSEFCFNNQVGPPIVGPLELGGLTLVEVTTPDGKTVTATADCSLEDNYNRRRGLSIALGRALAQLPKE